MRRSLFAVVGVPAGLLAINVSVERRRQCGCAEVCWCKSRVGQRLRWVLPLTHDRPLRQARLR